MASVTFHPEALQEYRAALGWYQQRNATAATRFVAEVDRILDQIGIQPDRYGWYDTVFREAGLRRYPYSIVYRIEESGDVIVVAISHSSREPGYWKDRA